MTGNSEFVNVKKPSASVKAEGFFASTKVDLKFQNPGVADSG